MSQHSRKSKLVIAAVLGSATLLLGVLPFIFMTLPDPLPVKVPGLEGERVGTYINDGGTFYRLFPYTAPAADFPPEAFATAASPLVHFKYRQPGEISIYSIRPWGGGEEVPAQKTVLGNNELLIKPVADLVPGEYFITAARDGIYGGVDYFYFRVTGAGSA